MDSESWLQVSLTVDGEMAEAVAEVLARFAPGGVALETTQILPDPEGEGRPAGPLRVCAYLPVDENIEETRQRLKESLWYLGRIRPLPEPQFELLAVTSWIEAWREHYRPLAVGQRLQIVPAWLEPPNSQRLSVRIEPGMAFGTGTHPTTQMCLEAIEEFFRSKVHQQSLTAIDIGCGSGILSIAALKLGAEHVLGVDIDPEALESARQNAELNGVSAALELRQGSVTEVREGAFSLQKAPLVLANLLAPIILRLLAEGLGELLSPGGTLVLSGI
ncbi:MAG TPA: 50S ribosomal protein L11 methyltransferase, partial [Anaerolineales bacterium]|nr:50S ribosomal protein L11 methyltransferase [Anaerolineales bacterium]